MASSFQPYAPAPSGFGYNDPTKPPPAVEGGNWLWDAGKAAWGFIKDNAGSIANAAGSALQAYESEQQTKEKLAEQKAEFEANLAQRQKEAETQAGQFGRTTGDTEAQNAVRAQTSLNTAPLADKAQALILARMGVSPGAFKPRDYTGGSAGFRSMPAPGAAVATAMQKSAAGYKPGDGGVDTSVTKALLQKLIGSSGLNVTPQGPTTHLPDISGTGTPVKPGDPGYPTHFPTTFGHTGQPTGVPRGTSADETDPQELLLRKMQYAT